MLLQNCHLGLDYMNELIDFILEMESPHDNFRIWITTEPHNDFPISLLQMSIKFTYEPPQGIAQLIFFLFFIPSFILSHFAHLRPDKFAESDK